MRHDLRSGFTLLELAIAVFLVALIGVAATNGMRTSLRALSGAEISSLATSAAQEYHEFTRALDLDSLDALSGSMAAPVMGNGQPLPGASALSLEIQILPVDDFDPNQTVVGSASRSRLVTLFCWYDERVVLETAWLATEH